MFCFCFNNTHKPQLFIDHVASFCFGFLPLACCFRCLLAASFLCNSFGRSRFGLSLKAFGYITADDLVLYIVG